MVQAEGITGKLPQVAILFSQFGAFHVDRVEAAARRLAGRAEVLAVEYAPRSETYAWEPAQGFDAARHVTLFPSRSYEKIGQRDLFRAAREALVGADTVCVGVPYSEPHMVALSWRLAAAGKRMVMMTESKFDDFPRVLWREQAKAKLLSPYRAAIVGGPRQRDYLRFLGFGKRPILPGYDTVGSARIRLQAGLPSRPWEKRDFLYVGRFVEKKNLPTLLAAYARYRELTTVTPRRLILVGDGELAGALQAQAGEGVIFTGFLRAENVARRMGNALALCLVSTVEQWGLVVNEAAAVGVPAIVSAPVGARDVLVRNGVNGFVVEPQSVEGIARAMLALAADEGKWRRHSEATLARANFGDVGRFADAIETLILPNTAEAAAERIAAFWHAATET